MQGKNKPARAGGLNGACNANCDLVHMRSSPSRATTASSMPRLEALTWRRTMAAIARDLSRISRIDLDVETLKTLVIFCGVGLVVSLLFASYGLDLSVGFF